MLHIFYYLAHGTDGSVIDMTTSYINHYSLQHSVNARPYAVLPTAHWSAIKTYAN